MLPGKSTLIRTSWSKHTERVPFHLPLTSSYLLFFPFICVHSLSFPLAVVPTSLSQRKINSEGVASSFHVGPCCPFLSLAFISVSGLPCTGHDEKGQVSRVNHGPAPHACSFVNATKNNMIFSERYVLGRWKRFFYSTRLQGV